MKHRLDETDEAKAVRLFHEALEAASEIDYIGHGGVEDGWVDDNSSRIVPALLAAGWVPPRE